MESQTQQSLFVQGEKAGTWALALSLLGFLFPLLWIGAIFTGHRARRLMLRATQGISSGSKGTIACAIAYPCLLISIALITAAFYYSSKGMKADAQKIQALLNPAWLIQEHYVSGNPPEKFYNGKIENNSFRMVENVDCDSPIFFMERQQPWLITEGKWDTIISNLRLSPSFPRDEKREIISVECYDSQSNKYIKHSYLIPLDPNSMLWQTEGVYYLLRVVQ